MCKYAWINNALEIHCALLFGAFIYHADRSVDLDRPKECPYLTKHIDCDQLKRRETNE